MENLFRFAVVRPATALDADGPLNVARDSAFQQALLRATQHTRPRIAMKATAAEFSASERMVRAVTALRWGAGFASMRAELRDVADAADLTRHIEQWFGTTPASLVADPGFWDDDERCADSTIAIKLLPAEHRAAASAIADVLRHASIVERVVKGDPTLAGPGGLERARRRALSLPPRMFPIPPDIGRPARPPTLPTFTPEIDRARAAVTQHQLALDELVALDLAAIRGDDEEAPIVPQDGVDGRPLQGTLARGRLAPLILRPAAAAALGESTRAVLGTHRLDPAVLPLDRITTQVAARLAEASRTLFKLMVDAGRVRVGMIGRRPAPIAHGTGHPQPHPGTGVPGVPSSHGNIRSVGVADLLVVKQALKRYEARDIAHLENVLQGESKRREHSRSTTTEQFTISEIERVREEEREHESTERFEMSRASSETISQDASLVSGLTVSGSYGPNIDFEASIEGALEHARERAVETASQYSRDVTERSRKRISETVRETRSLRIVNTVAERNEHVLDNVGGAAPVRGIYQWLEKVYDAQIFNYGLRAMFDFMVPEPAAFAIHAMQSGFADATQVERPVDFDLTPAQITESNYHYYVLAWEAAGLTPPPEPFVTVTKTFRGGPEGPDGETRGMTIDAAEVPLAEGYQAMAAVAVSRWGAWEVDTAPTIKISVGRRAHTWSPDIDVAWSTSLDGEVGSVGVAVRSWRTSSFTLVVEITCQRTARALDKWRLETHAALLQAYQQQRARYEDQLQALRNRAGVEIAGRNPAQNRELERRELKKACVSILTAQHFDMFGAIELAADGSPQPQLQETALEGAYIRFFEQAFEWHNATYIFYPYFWGHRATWIDRFQYDDIDPTFAAFLRAGAARVVVPLRPGFELAIDHFLSTGDVWQGAEPPSVTSDTYVPIIEEIAEQLGSPGNEVAVGNPWEVSVPTSLVLLRSDGNLPRWRKDADGRWVPEEP